MPKDETSDFFANEKKPETPTASPDNMGKWIGVAEKGIGLVEQLMAMKKAKEGGSSGGETAAHEKGLAQGQAIAQAQLPAPQPAPAIKVNYRTEEATSFLITSLENLDKKKTIGEYLDGDIKQMKNAGMLNGLMAKFLKDFVEVSQ